MSRTRCPACASATATFVDTVVLPSPGVELVMTTSRPPWSVDENSTLVRIDRKLSAKLFGTPLPMSGAVRSCRTEPEPSEKRQTEMLLQLVGVLDTVVCILECECETDRERQAAEQRHQEIVEDVRRHGTGSHFSVIDDANVTRADFFRDARLLSSLEQCFEHLTVRVGIALQNAGSMPARFRTCASCFCELSSVASVRSSASAASYSRRIASATCATSAWIFASAV